MDGSGSAVVVVGAGQAGVAAVARLRARGHRGAITLIGDEPVAPYQRPPLSKDYLKGKMDLERLTLRAESFYAENDIALRRGTRATAIDRAARQVHLDDGEALAYDHLVLATGARPRRLPAAAGGGLAGVHCIRTLADVDAMAPEFVAGRRVLIVGGGYIGLEAAAVAAGLGLSVVVLEAAPRILGRVAAPEVADYFRALHRAHGVEILEGTGLARLTADAGGRVSGAELADGRHLAADFAIVGIGVEPETTLAAAAGLALDNGIATDDRGQTSDPTIWAAGDCASFPFRGGRVRLESVQNAIEQAECVADNILGQDSHYAPLPWFWSDQYDARFQIAGLSTGYERVVIRPGPTPADGAAPQVAFWYYVGDRLIAVDAINDSRSYLVAKRLLDMGRSADPAKVADPATDLKSLLA
ncbi:MAG: FAD-dependent oxidoreductase [Rhodobacteraceae bacterium]|nr:FAD-dependent oxidoreductase [Paracoccaceae bacterium]